MSNCVEPIYIDDDLIVIDKPAGLCTIPDGYHSEVSNLRDILEMTFDKLWVVHRLDKETSGAIIFARSEKVHKLLNRQFELHSIQKKYITLIYGNLYPDFISLKLPLLKNADRYHRTLVDRNTGKDTRTDFIQIEKFSRISKVEAHPYTGYTHQIRSHLAYLNHPIIGDKLYTRKNLFILPIIPPRMFLHCQELVFNHPMKGNLISSKCPLPEDFAIFIQKITIL
jgi:RluA family pseudouridine synthase